MFFFFFLGELGLLFLAEVGVGWLPLVLFLFVAVAVADLDLSFDLDAAFGEDLEGELAFELLPPMPFPLQLPLDLGLLPSFVFGGEP